MLKLRANIPVFSEVSCAVLEDGGSNGQLEYFSGSVFFKTWKYAYMQVRIWFQNFKKHQCVSSDCSLLSRVTIAMTSVV